MAIDSPTDDAFRPDTKHLGVKTGTQCGAAHCHNFGSAPYFNPAYRPRIHRNHVVHYKSYAGIVKNVSVLLSVGKATVAADFECIFVRVIAKAYRHNVGS